MSYVHDETERTRKIATVMVDLGMAQGNYLDDKIFIPYISAASI